MADKAGLNIKVISVPDAKDPAELCATDPKKWSQAVKDATPIYDYYLESIKRRFDFKKAQDKKDGLLEILPIWQKISDPIVRDHYIEKLAALIQVKESLIKSELQKLQRSTPTTPRVDRINTLPKVAPTKNPTELHDRRNLLEEYLVTLLLHIPEDLTFVPNFPETLFMKDNLKQLYVMQVLFLDSISFKGKSFKINEFIKTLPQDLATEVDKMYLTQIDEKLAESKSWEKEVKMVVAGLKKMLIKSSLEKLTLQIKSAQEFEEAEQLDALNKRFRDLSIKLKNL